MIVYNDEEQAADDHLIAFMGQLRDWGLMCNEHELANAIHTLQLYTIMHMLQRLGADGFSDWYKEA